MSDFLEDKMKQIKDSFAERVNADLLSPTTWRVYEAPYNRGLTRLEKFLCKLKFSIPLPFVTKDGWDYQGCLIVGIRWRQFRLYKPKNYYQKFPEVQYLGMKYVLDSNLNARSGISDFDRGIPEPEEPK